MPNYSGLSWMPNSNGNKANNWAVGPRNLVAGRITYILVSRWGVISPSRLIGFSGK